MPNTIKRSVHLIAALLSFSMLVPACKANKTDEAPMFIQPEKKNYVISSPMNGQLLKGGEPLGNAKLVRTLEWNGDKEGSKEEIFVTDENGYFSFPIFELEMAMRGLEQFVAKTKIYHISANKEQELIWYSSTMHEFIHGDTGKELKNLTCDVLGVKVVVHDTPGQVLTNCRWDSMPDYSEFIDYSFD